VRLFPSSPAPIHNTITAIALRDIVPVVIACWRLSCLAELLPKELY
jgi:hypothetical protein